jgi:hypothetical protein
MAQKTDQPSRGRPSDIQTDYALIMTAVGAALVALVYLILI